MDPSNSNLTKLIKKLPSESDDLSKYNIFNIIASVCNTCVSKICELLPTPSVLTFATACKPCNYDESINNVDQIKNDSIELRLIYDNEIHEDLDRVEYISDSKSCKPCYAYNCLINQPKSITYAPWQQKMAGNPAYGDGGQLDHRHLSRFGVPIEKYFQNFQSASIENYPLLTEGKHVDIYDPICDKACYLCGQCECKYKPKLEWNSRDNLEPQSCKCSLCECLSCPYQKEASFAEESLESSKRNVIHNYIEHERKGSLGNNEHQIQACRTANMCCRHFRDSSKINAGKFSKEKCSLTCSKRGNNRKRWHCSQNDICSTLNKVYTIYEPDFQTEESDKNVSTENPNKIITGQLLKNMYGDNTVTDQHTNTENLTAHKCIETVNSLANKKSLVDNKVSSYEYTLKIEIKAPNFDENMKEDIKQRIKKASKNKIIERTQKVMKDVIIDITNNSLLHEMFGTEHPSALQPSESENPESIGDMKSQDQNEIRSISNKISPVSLNSTTMASQNSSDMVTALPRSNCSKVAGNNLSCNCTRCAHDVVKAQYSVCDENRRSVYRTSHILGSEPTAKMEDYIVGCVKEITAKKSELPWRDESLLSQSYWSPVPPESVELRTQVDVMEKLVGCVGSTADMNKSGKCLDDLRVQEPCLRRVSNHTVSLKWKLPVLFEEIEGYEILVDGKIIEKILNPKRCLAVVSCLPPVRRLMITIRTLPKTPSLRGFYPCTTIGYQPRSNKREDFWTA